MGQTLSAIDNKLKILYDYIMLIAGSAVVLLMMVAAFLRYVFKINFHGSEEIILLFGYWLYFFGSISAARASTHLSAEMVNIFTRNQNLINVCRVIRNFVSLLICILAIKWCWEYWSWSLNLKPVTSVHRIPYYLQQFPMCLSFLLWGFYLIRDCYKSVKYFETKR